LNARYKELEAALETFRKITGGNQPKASSWSSLTQNITKIRNQYDTKASTGFQGKSKRLFHSICETLNNHSNVLKILPQGDKYTSLVCGSLEVIIKVILSYILIFGDILIIFQASVNHQSVGEDFAAAWKEIDRTVAVTKRELSECPNPEMLELAVELSCKIIEFVTFFFSWYSQKWHKRFLASFNENLSKEYEPYLQEIREISALIQRGVQFFMMKEGRERSLEAARFFRDVKEFHQRDNWKRDEDQWELMHRAQEEHYRQMREQGSLFMANFSQELKLMLEQQCGKSVKQILDGSAQQFVSNFNEQRRVETVTLVPTDSPEPSMDTRSVERIMAMESERSVEEASGDLDRFFDYAYVHPTPPETDTFIEMNAFQRLQAWNTEIHSSILGIFGPAMRQEENSARLLALKYVQAARAGGVPCVSYFCNLREEEPPAGRIKESIGTISLLYALMKQLILYIPLGLNDSTQLNASHFEELDGTFRTWTAALSVFRELLRMSSPPILLIVIHGLEMLDHQYTRTYLASFLEELRYAISHGSSSANPDRILKVLFVTSGSSLTLNEGLAVDEICDVSWGSAGRKPGRVGQGRLNISGMAF
jgi:hypothetical protein